MLSHLINFSRLLFLFFPTPLTRSISNRLSNFTTAKIYHGVTSWKRAEQPQHQEMEAPVEGSSHSTPAKFVRKFMRCELLEAEMLESLILGAQSARDNFVQQDIAQASEPDPRSFACPFYKFEATSDRRYSRVYRKYDLHRYSNVKAHIMRCHSLRPADSYAFADYDAVCAHHAGERDAIFWSQQRARVSGIKHAEIHGSLNGIDIKALPDSGSAINAVSEQFARLNGLEIETTEQESIPLLGGHAAESIGRVVAQFKFKGETGIHHLEFHVLRKSVQDVILGRSFLNKTKTFTKHAHRIVHCVRPCIQRGNRLFLMDQAPRERIRCSVNGSAATAFPDTGSDLMLVSGDFARRNGFHIHRGKEYRTQIELIDGSTIRTDGMVLDTELQFDIPTSSYELDYHHYDKYFSELSSLTRREGEPPKSTFICDLHVVEDLPCDIILSNDFISQNKVFSRFKSLFYTEKSNSQMGSSTSLGRCLMFVRSKSGKIPWFSRRRARSTNSGTNASKCDP